MTSRVVLKKPIYRELLGLHGKRHLYIDERFFYKKKARSNYWICKTRSCKATITCCLDNNEVIKSHKTNKPHAKDCEKISLDQAYNLHLKALIKNRIEKEVNTNQKTIFNEEIDAFKSSDAYKELVYLLF